MSNQQLETPLTDRRLIDGLSMGSVDWSTFKMLNFRWWKLTTVLGLIRGTFFTSVISNWNRNLWEFKIYSKRQTMEVDYGLLIDRRAILHVHRLQLIGIMNEY